MDEHHVVPTLLQLIEILKIHDSRIGLYVSHSINDAIINTKFTNGSMKIDKTILESFRDGNFLLNQGTLNELLSKYQREK